MPPLRIVLLLILCVPVALITYFATANVLAGMDMPEGIGGILMIFLPLLVAGVCSIPFLAPFVDFKAKQALANAPSRIAADAPANAGPSSAPKVPSARKDEPGQGPDAG